MVKYISYAIIWRKGGHAAVEKQEIAILLAIYNPERSWLAELLDSLDRQTYPALRLYVRDDASTTITAGELSELLRRHITHLPFVLHRNEVNQGSNVTFEKLVEDCHEPYVMFCDQDDIWLPEKAESTLRLFDESPLSPTLVCTNVSVIDGEGNETAPSIDVHRRRHVFLRGEGLAPQLIYRNFVMGCTILAKRDRLLSYLPFPSSVVHDHYIAFRAATEGAIDFLAEPQMKYRVYGGNQTGVMTGVKTKADYFDRRIALFEQRLAAFSAVAEFSELAEAREWVAARIANFNREKGGFRRLWRMRYVNRVTSLFELVVLRLPTPLFRFAIRLVQKGVL